jgi:transcriptional regulator with XRE-family HTH domain
VDAAGTVRRARRAARLTQRDLAKRTGVGQGAIGRIETGAVEPRFDTVTALLRGCGWELDARPLVSPEVDRADIRYALALSDRERERYFLESNRNVLRMFASARSR